MVRLSELPSFTPAVVETVEHLSADDTIARRLADLGFVPGETVRITASGPVGADPLRRCTTVYLQRGERVTFTARTPVKMLHLGMPDLTGLAVKRTEMAAAAE